MMRFSSKKRIVLYSILFFLVILAAAACLDIPGGRATLNPRVKTR